MITGKTLRDAIISGANNIANQRTRVDELNVFPVPDGDTGTNMSMTIGAALSELNAMPDTCTVAEASKSAASAMLRGARGNSGVITSLLFRGFSKALAGKTDAEAADLAKALQMGVEAAYKAVMKPTEGTILTVTRLAAEAAVAAETDDVPQLWATVCEAGQKALAAAGHPAGPHIPAPAGRSGSGGRRAALRCFRKPAAGAPQQPGLRCAQAGAGFPAGSSCRQRGPRNNIRFQVPAFPPHRAR